MPTVMLPGGAIGVWGNKKELLPPRALGIWHEAILVGAFEVIFCFS